MPPAPRRARGPAARSAPYITRGWLSRCRRALDGDGEERPLEHDEVTTSALQDDALAAVFARLRDGPAVVRCAATCRRWGRVVRNEAASLSRTLPLLGALALGFFHLQNDGAGRRRDAAKGPTFVPTASATRLLGFHGHSARSLLHAGGVDLEGSRPVASRNGRLVLELRRERRGDGLRLCVCDPMTGEADVLPPLRGEDMPGDYACALLTGDDVEPPVFSPAYSRLLLVYNRRGFTALRGYSSDTGSWGAEGKADVRISSGWLRNMVLRATALRGVVYWPLALHVLGVRLDGGGTAMEQYRISYGCPQPTPVNKAGKNLTIGVSAEGRLCLIIMVMHGRHTVGVRAQNLLNDDDSCNGNGNGNGDVTAGRWGPRDVVVNLDQFRQNSDAMAMTNRWYCDKSGVFFFTLGEGSSVRGTFALNLKTKELEKIDDRESWTSFCGYEMGRDMYLRSLLVPP